MSRRECHPLDGVPVRVSSEVRPPKSITLPTHLLKSLLPASLSYEYDFSLEHRVLHEAQMERERRAKLEALRPTAAVTPLPASQQVPPGGGEVLTPQIPSSSTSPDDSASLPEAKPKINLIEFEPETYSPFDQVELQTLNDFEELNSIFGKLRTSNSAPPTPVAKETPSSGSARASPLNAAGNVTVPVQPTNPAGSAATATGAAIPVTTTSNCHQLPSEPVSIKNLFDEEQLARVSRGYHYRPMPPPAVPQQQRPPTNPIDDLPSHLQMLAKQFVSMGFPASRVARAVMDLGHDEPKVVEHLCLIQTLTEDGFDERDAAQALQFNGPDLASAREFLKALGQLGDLGFNRGDIVLALKLHKNDRDKVLDELLSK